jgi:hypothetical protein
VFFLGVPDCEQDGRQGQLDSRSKRRGYDDFRSNVSIVMLSVVKSIRTGRKTDVKQYRRPYLPNLQDEASKRLSFRVAKKSELRTMEPRPKVQAKKDWALLVGMTNSSEAISEAGNRCSPSRIVFADDLSALIW